MIILQYDRRYFQTWTIENVYYAKHVKYRIIASSKTSEKHAIKNLMLKLKNKNKNK